MLWGLLLALVLVAGGYVAAAAALAGRVPADVAVAGVDVGGTARDEAADRIAAGLRPADPVPVRVGEVEASLDPAETGLSVDADATASDLVGFSLDPRVLWRHVDGAADVEPVTAVDEPALTAALEGLASDADTEPVEGAVAFDSGEAVVTEAAAGWELRVDEAAEVVADDWFGATEALELPIDTREPDVDQDAVEAAVSEFAAPATAGPLVVRVGSRTVQLPPAKVTPALAMTARDGELRPAVDGDVLLEAVMDADDRLVADPVDATVRLQGGQGGRPAVVPGRNGTRIDAAELAGRTRAALGTPERTVTLEPDVAEPELTTAEAEALGVTQVLSEFATPLTDDALRTENLRVAARTVSGTLVMPGETFSLNGTLGERTRAKGYNAAGFISNGRLRDTVGGGVSQMATTLFNGMFFAGLEDVYHQPHSFYISRYPEGREATINWPTIDLEFRNDSDNGVLVDAWVAGGEVHTRFWGTKRYDIRAGKGPRHNIVQPEQEVDDSAECTPQNPNVGFDVDVTRRFVQDGETERVERFATRYLPSTGVTCT